MQVNTEYMKCFYKEGDKFIFLIKAPFTIQKIKEVNPIHYKYFTMWEIMDSGMLIGYSFKFKEEAIYSRNFVGYFNNQEPKVTSKQNLLFMNKNLLIFEDTKAQSALVIGNPNG